MNKNNIRINNNISQSQAVSSGGSATANSVSENQNQVNNQAGNNNKNNSSQGNNSIYENQGTGLIDYTKGLPVSQIKAICITLFIISILTLMTPEIIGITGAFASIAGFVLALKGNIGT